MSASRVQRIDYVGDTLAKPEFTAEGYWKLSGKIARVGIQEYVDSDGKTVRELRLPEDVEASVPGFALTPLTNNHPSELLTPKNAQQYAIGAVGDATFSGDWVSAPLTIWAQTAIDAVKAGKAQLSVGYSCVLVEEPGVWRGERYDCRQTAIVPNHLAIVDAARAGPEARLRLDRKDGVAVSGLNRFIGADSARKKDTKMEATKRLTIGDQTYGLGEMDKAQSHIHQVLADLAATRAQRDALARSKDGDDEGDDEPVECSDCTGTGIKDGMVCDKCDGSGELAAKGGKPRDEKAELEGAASAHSDTSSRRAARRRKRTDALQGAIRKRVALEVRAHEVLGRDVKLDGLDDISVMKLVIMRRSPSTIVDGKSRDYIYGIFDHLTESTAAAASATIASRLSKSDAIRAATMAPAQLEPSTDHLDADAARARMVARLRDAWKQPSSKGDAAAQRSRPTTPQEAHAAMARRNREAAVRK